MADLRLVRLGLNALARAHTLDYFADGHRGAAMVAAYLLGADGVVDARGAARIAALVDHAWASSPLCAPFPASEPVPEGIAAIGDALLAGAETLREVGHNVIFAMLAIKGFALMPEAATPERIAGVCALVRAIKPWHDVAPDPAVAPPPFSDAAAAAQFVLAEASAAIDRFVGFGQGFAGHMLTFGQALVELALMGHIELAEACRPAFRKYVTVTREGPWPDAREYPDHAPTDLRPTDAAYWERRSADSLGIGHAFKYPYSAYALARYADDPALIRAFDAKAYRLF